MRSPLRIARMAGGGQSPLSLNYANPWYGGPNAPLSYYTGMDITPEDILGGRPSGAQPQGSFGGPSASGPGGSGAPGSGPIGGRAVGDVTDVESPDLGSWLSSIMTGISMAVPGITQAPSFAYGLFNAENGKPANMLGDIGNKVKDAFGPSIKDLVKDLNSDLDPGNDDLSSSGPSNDADKDAGAWSDGYAGSAADMGGIGDAGVAGWSDGYAGAASDMGGNEGGGGGFDGGGWGGDWARGGPVHMAEGGALNDDPEGQRYMTHQPPAEIDPRTRAFSEGVRNFHLPSGQQILFGNYLRDDVLPFAQELLDLGSYARDPIDRIRRGEGTLLDPTIAVGGALTGLAGVAPAGAGPVSRALGPLSHMAWEGSKGMGRKVLPTAVPALAGAMTFPAEAEAQPKNERPEPTDAQKEAGNYKKDHLKLHGLDISIETPKGAMRRSKPDAKDKWEVQMPSDYGYIKGTNGADDEQVDIYVGPYPEHDKVHVIDQHDAKTGKFDEHKIMLGFPTLKAAEEAYDAAFSDGKGPERRKKSTSMDTAMLKEWLKRGDLKKSLSGPANKDFSQGPVSDGDVAFGATIKDYLAFMKSVPKAEQHAQ